MAIPDSPAFSLGDVITELGLPVASSLSGAFAAADPTKFDDTYEGSLNRLSNFRNYGAAVGINPGNLVDTGISAPITGHSYGAAGIRMSPDGLIMLILRDKGAVQTYSLSTPWDITTLVDTGGDDVWDGWTRGFGVSDDGTKIYLCQRDSTRIDQWNLSTPWDPLTATHIGQNNDFLAERPVTLLWQPDGLRCIVLDTHDTIGHSLNQCDLTVAWDISTATKIIDIPITDQAGKGLPVDGLWDNEGKNYWWLSTVLNGFVGFSPNTTADYDLTKFVSSTQLVSSPSILTDARGFVHIPGTSQIIVLHNGDLLKVWDMPA